MVVVTPAKTESRSCRRYLGASFSEKGVAKWLCRPGRSRMIGHRDVDDPSALVFENTSTKRSRNVTVGTTKRSAAMIWLA
jgi:hypothetical protein